PTPAKPVPTVRLKSDDEDPFQQKHALPEPDSRASQFLARAEGEFSQQHFGEARLLYEQAHEVDPACTQSCGERWAYCKLYGVVDQLSHADAAKMNWAAMECEVDAALQLAPRLEYGKTLRTEIQKRRQASGLADESRPDRTIAVRHLPGRGDGWLVAESANFRIFHNQSPEFAERVAGVAERTRAAVQQKWFGSSSETWSPKCALFL